MGGRQSSSRSQSGTKRRSQAPARGKMAATERGSTGALLFFLIVFLVLLVVLLQARLGRGQFILLMFVLGVLLICLLGAWWVRKNGIGRSEQTFILPRAELKESVTASRVQVGPVLLPHSATISDFLRLSPGEFEDFVGDLLEAIGQWSDVRRVGGTGDHGADLLARDRFGRPFIVQCKRYQPGRKVGAREIRDFLGARGIYRADEGLFVTTSSFTEAARADARPFQHTVFLWDGEKLLQLIQAYWEELPARWKE